VFSLILKDLLPQWKSKAMLPGVISILAGCYFLHSGMMLAVFMLFIPTYTSYTYASAYDYKYNQERFFLSLPVSRTQWVIARYLSALVVFAVSLIVAGGVGLLGLALSLPFAPPSLGVIALECLILSFYLGIAFPAYFKLGYVKSRWVNFVVMILVAIVSSALSGVSEVSGAVGAADAGILTSKIDPGLIVFGLAASLAAMAASLGISLIIFRKREF